MSQLISMTEETLARQLKANVAQLCSLDGWSGINKVQNRLGGSVSKELHDKQVRVPRDSHHGGAAACPSAGPPPGSPFADGGVVVIQGNTGMGKIEFAEHIVLHSVKGLCMLPMFGTVGPRVFDQEWLGVELLRSTVGVVRHLDPSVPQDDLHALQHIAPPHLAGSLAQVREAFTDKIDEDKRMAVLNMLIDLVVALLEELRKQTSIVIVLHLGYSTILFTKTLESFDPFWSVVSALMKIAIPEAGACSGNKLVVLTILVKAAQEAETEPHQTIQILMQKGWFVELSAISEDICVGYAQAYLRAPPDTVNMQLQRFVAKVSLGNPLYIRETIDQLLLHEYIKAQKNASGEVQGVQYLQDLEGINVAAWAQPALIGETVCLLESLDPLEATVLKMNTCLIGPFTLPDLASSSRSRWSGVTFFDCLRLFRAIQDLVKRGIIEVQRRQRSRIQLEDGAPIAQLQTFEIRNVLIRKVGGSMVLEAQKKVVMRQALIDRALSRDLPERMEEVFAKRLEPHIPWCYENVLAKRA